MQSLGVLETSGLALGPLKNISIPGLFNFGWITCVTGAFALSLWRERNLFLGLSKPVRWVVICVSLFPLGLVLNLVTLDSLAVVAMENMILFSTLLIGWLVLPSPEIRFPTFYNFAPRVLGVSLLLALGLPLLIPIEGRDVWGHFYPIDRYIGWHGEGAPYATMGVVLILVGAHRAVRAFNREYVYYMVLGWFAIWVNVHRISMAAAAVGLGALFVVSAFKEKQKYWVLGASLLCLISLFVGDMGEKGKRFIHSNNYWQSKSFDSKQATLDHFVATSGRLETAEKLLSKDVFDQGYTSRGFALSQWIGTGTGSAPRIIRQILPRKLEPNCDFVRIRVEHGWLGFVFFFGTLAWLGIFALRNSHMNFSVPALLSLLVMMIAENPLVLPTYITGPLLLAALLGKETQRSSALLDKQKSTNG